MTREGATKVTDEVTKAKDVSGGTEVELTPYGEDGEDAEVVATTTVARFTVTVSLKPSGRLADANFSISLDDDVTIKVRRRRE